MSWADDRLEARGTAGDTLDLAVDLAAPNLAVLLPAAGGSLTVQGTVRGAAPAPHFDLTAHGESLVYGGYSAGDVQLAANVDLAAGGPLDLAVTATGVSLGTRDLDRLQVSARGTRADHTIDMTAVADAAQGTALAATLHGGLVEIGGADASTAGGFVGLAALTQATWDGRLTRLDLDTAAAADLGLPDLGTWSLEAPAGLTLAADAATLDGFCWGGQGRLCADAAWQSGGGWHADATLAGVPLGLVQTLLPSGVEVTGDVDGTLTARADAAGTLTADVDLRPGPGVLRYPAASEREQQLHFAAGRVTASAGPATGVTADLSLPLPDLGTLEGHLELPGFDRLGMPADGQPVSGHLAADLSDVGFLQAFVDGLNGVAGSLDADVTVAGTVGDPQVQGRAVIADGRADYPEYGLELRDLQLTLHGDGTGPLSLDGSVRSSSGSGSGGRLQLAGSIPLAPSEATPARLQIEGQRFEVADTDELHVYASPDLTLTFDGRVARVSGEVTVPEAQIEIAKPKQGAVNASSDVVFVGPEAEPANGRAFVLAARVRLVLGDDVEVDAFGLHAEPTGSLLVIEEPGRPTSASGELDVDGGTFQAYGQDLTIDSGRLVYAGGPITNPGINLRASRTADDGTVAGLQATGTLEGAGGHPVVRAADVADRSARLPAARPPARRVQRLGGEPVDQRRHLAGPQGRQPPGRPPRRPLRPRGGALRDRGLLRAGAAGARQVPLAAPLRRLRHRSLRGGQHLPHPLPAERSAHPRGETGAATSADLLYTLERGRGAKKEAPPGSAADALGEQPKVPSEEGPGPDESPEDTVDDTGGG